MVIITVVKLVETMLSNPDGYHYCWKDFADDFSEPIYLYGVLLALRDDTDI
jgi:hypothetical protein